jgi:hypothetical protein
MPVETDSGSLMKNDSKTQSAGDWKIVVARSFEEIEAIRPAWKQMQENEPYPTPYADIDRHIFVTKARGDDVRPYVVLLERNDCPAAMIIGWAEEHQLRLKLGYRNLFGARLRCLSVVYGGVLGRRTNDVCSAVVRELMNVLARGEADVVFINHVATDSLLYRVATKMPNFLSRTHFAEVKPHWSMPIPESVEPLYQSFAPKTRSTLRRKMRKLEKEFTDQIKIMTYRDENRLEEAMCAASQVSRHTYQTALGWGFVNDSRTRETLAAAAHRGWLRMSIVYIKEEPCAFQLGLQYGKTYFLEQLEFHPRWKQWNVGTVLFMKVLEDLCRDPSVERFNFGFGDAQYKRSYGNECWDESSVYIFAPRLYPVLVSVLHSSMEGVSLGLKYVLDRFGMVRSVKRRWRNLLQKHNGD